MTITHIRCGAPAIRLTKVVPIENNNGVDYLEKLGAAVITIGDILEGTLRSKRRMETQVLKFTAAGKLDLMADDKVNIKITYPPDGFGNCEERHIEAAEVIEIVHHLPTRRTMESWDYSFEWIEP